jgi:colanic acid/amylovoran biosynthesis glycosyltransferase
MTAVPGQAAGSAVLTHKFVEGAREYSKHWPGSITVWIQKVDSQDNNLDHVEIHPSEQPFDLRWLSGSSDDRFLPAIRESDLVLAALVPKHVCLADQCGEARVPLTYITEYSVTTRRQIVRSETRNPLLRWRRELWAIQCERKYRRAVRAATSVQCNGTPTFNAYKGINNHALLFFDTRVASDQLISSTDLDRRLADLAQQRPLRLAFSGRLIAMKGVDHLPVVARELLRLGVPVTMDICGGGNLEAQLRADIERMGLVAYVRLRGVLDFATELLPFVSREVDLFVCCHRQGDPSCTYLETYSCGVPIVGYANEAFAGLVDVSGVGGRDWVTPLDDPIALARRIAELSSRRQEIAQAARTARAFAARNTFESTFKSRIAHMLESMSAPSSGVPAAAF